MTFDELDQIYNRLKINPLINILSVYRISEGYTIIIKIKDILRRYYIKSIEDFIKIYKKHFPELLKDIKLK
jgi:hypothetical protein